MAAGGICIVCMLPVRRNGVFMRLKKFIIAALSTTFVAGMTISAFAQSFDDWYFNKYGYYPGGNMDYWYGTSDYDQYLSDNGYGYSTDSYDYPDYSDSSTTYYYYDYTDYSKYYADVTDAYWSGNTAKWDVDGRASKYQVRVYRDGSRINTHDTKNKSYSLASDITKDGYYYFEVRAYNSSSGWSDWQESDDKYYSPQAASNASSGSGSSAVMMIGPGGSVSQAQWIQTNDGTGRWWYKHADGGYTSNGWELINGKWYYFDAAGWMKTGWLTVGGSTYYLGSDGAMVTGYNYIDGANHNFDSNGKMLN